MGCRHKWGQTQRWTSFSSNVIDYQKKCLKCGKIKRWTVAKGEIKKQKQFKHRYPSRNRGLDNAKRIYDRVEREEKNKRIYKLVLIIVFVSLIYFSLMSIYPNDFNSFTQISTSLLSNSKTTMTDFLEEKTGEVSSAQLSISQMESKKTVLEYIDNKTDLIEIGPLCKDSTPYGECSKNRSYQCVNGSLIRNPSTCGCPRKEFLRDGECIPEYRVRPKNISFEYMLRGKHGKINMTLYGGLNTLLSNLPRSYYCTPTCPTDRELELRFLDNENQKTLLSELVPKIQNITDNKDDQARISISLVQTIPYDWDQFRAGDLSGGKYPYEVLYQGAGVCGEKSKLLAFLLRELEFGVVLFDFPRENHQAVGIKCPVRFSFENTGYCFVESASQTIITDDQGDYVGVGKLSRAPEITEIASGQSFDSVLEEYKDARRFREITHMGTILPSYIYNEWWALVNKYGIELSEE